jgi:hypothetical protein
MSPWAVSARSAPMADDNDRNSIKLMKSLRIGGLTRDRQSTEATAWHEAGHAAMAMELRVPVVSATIIPTDDFDGCVELRPPPEYVADFMDYVGVSPYEPMPLRVRDWFERRIMVSMAGELAQARQTGSASGSAAYADRPEFGMVVVDGDVHTQAELILDLVGENEVLASAYLEYLRARADDILNRTDVWCVVEAVALQLMAHRVLRALRLRAIRSTALSAWHAEVRAGHARFLGSTSR